MSRVGLVRRAGADARFAALAVAAAGCGIPLALVGGITGDLRFAAAGALAAGAGLVGLVAAGWLDAAAVVLLAAPLPALIDTDGGMRVAAVAPVTAAVVLACLLRRGAEDDPLATGTLPVRSLAALVGAFALATLTARYPVVSARELLNFAVLLGLLVALTDEFTRRRAALRTAAALLPIVAALTGTLAVLEAVGVLPGEFRLAGTGLHRAALGFGQPNGLGLFLAVSLPFAVHAVSTARSAGARALALGMLVATAAGLAVTFSRGAWLAVLAGTGPLLLTGDRRTVVRIWAVTLVAAAVIDIASGGALRLRFQQTLGDWVVEQRFALMLAGVMMFLAYPFTGVGPGGYADSLVRFGAQIPELWDYRPTPHNAYVQMAAEAGIVGLAAFALFLVVGMITLIRGARRAARDPDTTAEARGLHRAAVWAFGTLCAAGFVVWPFAHGAGQAVVLVAAIGFALGRRGDG